MRGLFNKTLGACSCAPFVPKMVDPFIIGAGISAAATIGTGVASGIQATNLNKENREYDWQKFEASQSYNTLEAERARAHQKALLKREQDWNERMYNMYNSPSAMRAQYEAAGYHPYLAAPEHGVGTSQMQASSPSAPSSPLGSVVGGGVPNTYVPDYGGVGRGLETLADSYLRSKSVNANVANQQQKTIQDALKNAFEIYKLTGSKEDANQILRLAVSTSAGVNADAPEFRILDISMNRMEIQRQFEQLQYDIEQEFGRSERGNKVMNMEMNFTRMAAEIGRMAVQNRLDESSIERVASEIARNFAAASLDSKNAKLLNDSMDYLVNRALNEANSAYYSALTAKGEYGIKAGVYSAASSEAGQFVEQTDYYLNKIVDKAGKLMKFNFSTGKFDSNIKGEYSSESKNKNWNIRSTWDPKNGYNVPNNNGVGTIDSHVRP